MLTSPNGRTLAARMDCLQVWLKACSLLVIGSSRDKGTSYTQCPEPPGAFFMKMTGLSSMPIFLEECSFFLSECLRGKAGCCCWMKRAWCNAHLHKLSRFHSR